MKGMLEVVQEQQEEDLRWQKKLDADQKREEERQAQIQAGRKKKAGYGKKSSSKSKKKAGDWTAFKKKLQPKLKSHNKTQENDQTSTTFLN